MIKLITLLLFAVAFSFAGTPTMDGTFDGVGVWGSPVATADTNTGWAGAQARVLYVTYDANYAYFGAEVKASTWMAWAFAINTKSGGGSSDSWSRQITYGHTDKPDFVARGHFNSYAQINYWDGSSWQGWDGLAASEFGENITTDANPEGWVEIRVPMSTLNAGIADVQFYITGNDNNHGTFDACPDDQNALGWNPPESVTILDNYQPNVPLPIQLASFVGSYVENGVKLEWSTISEVNNYGFNVQRQSGNEYVTIGFVEGKGTTLEPQSYEYIDVQPGTSYRLEQIDNDGLTTYYGPIMLNPNNVGSEPIPAVFALNQNYPNPFNPTTNITFSLANSGHTVLKVYNILGNEVATLFNGNAEAGKLYTAKFDASNLSTGMYIYKLQNGTSVEVRKLTLVK